MKLVEPVIQDQGGLSGFEILSLQIILEYKISIAGVINKAF
jgi:hypothetical protein